MLKAIRYQRAQPPKPDTATTEFEDELQRSSQGADLSGLSLKERPAGTLTLPRRLGYGTQGLLLTLWTNYVRVTPKNDAVFYRYSFTVKPDIPRTQRRKKEQLVRLLLEWLKLGDAIATDYSSTLISSQPLPQTQMSASIAYRFEKEDVPVANAQTYNIQITATNPNSFTLSGLINYLSNTSINATYAPLGDAIQALNIIFGTYPKRQDWSMSLSNRHYAIGSAQAPQDTCQSYDLGAGLEAWRGYLISLRTASNRLAVQVQIKHVAAYKPGSLKDLIEEYGKVNGRDLNRLNQFLKGVRVQTTHLTVKKNKKGEVIPRIKSIWGLAHPDDAHDASAAGQGVQVRHFGADAKNVRFWETDDSRFVSVHDYFKSKYQHDSPQGIPVVNIKNGDNPTYVPVTVCKVVPGQPARAKLSPNQTSAMINFAVRKPHENASSIAHDGTRVLGLEPESGVLKTFGMSVAKSLMTVPARKLNGPNVLYKGKQAITENGGWNMKQIKFEEGATMNCLGILCVNREGDQFPDRSTIIEAVNNFVSTMNKNLGMNVRTWRKEFALTTVTRQNLQPSLKAALNKFREGQQRPDYVLVIVSIADTLIYQQVKTFCDLQQGYGLHNSVVVAKKFTKRNNDGYFDVQYFVRTILIHNKCESSMLTNTVI